MTGDSTGGGTAVQMEQHETALSGGDSVHEAIQHAFKDAVNEPWCLTLPGAKAMLLAAGDEMDFKGVDVYVPEQGVLPKNFAGAVLDTGAGSLAVAQEAQMEFLRRELAQQPTTPVRQFNTLEV